MDENIKFPGQFKKTFGLSMTRDAFQALTKALNATMAGFNEVARQIAREVEAVNTLTTQVSDGCSRIHQGVEKMGRQAQKLDDQLNGFII